MKGEKKAVTQEMVSYWGGMLDLGATTLIHEFCRRYGAVEAERFDIGRNAGEKPQRRLKIVSKVY